jgi:hypothetical protein
MAVNERRPRMSDDQTAQVSKNDELGAVRDFCLVAVARIGVDAAAVTYRTTGAGLELLHTTDDVAERLAQLEMTLGEGPTFDAVASSLPTAVDDLRSPISTHRWPLFATEAVVAGVRAVVAYPIVLGGTTYGAVGLYSRQPQRLSSEQHRVAEDLTELIGLALVDPTSGQKVGTSFRMSVHQAAGMVMMQAGTSIHDALVMLRATAFAEDTRVTDLAADVIAGRRRFEKTEEVDD